MDLGSQREAVASGPRDREGGGKDRTRVHLSSKEEDRCCGSFLSLLSPSPSLLHSTQASSPALLPPSSRFSPQPNSHDVRTPVSHAPSERAERRKSEIRSAENGRRDNNSLSHTPLILFLFLFAFRDPRPKSNSSPGVSKAGKGKREMRLVSLQGCHNS